MLSIIRNINYKVHVIVFLLLSNFTYAAGSSTASQATSTITAQVANLPPELIVADQRINKSIAFGSPDEEITGEIRFAVMGYEDSDAAGNSLMTITYPVKISLAKGTLTTDMFLDAVPGAESGSVSGSDRKMVVKVPVKTYLNYAIPYRMVYLSTMELGKYSGSFVVNVEYN